MACERKLEGAPLLSRLSGIMQFRCVQRRKPRIFLPMSCSTDTAATRLACVPSCEPKK